MADPAMTETENEFVIESLNEIEMARNVSQ